MARPVLVIEDDLDILDMIKYILEDENYEVFTYPNIIDLTTVVSINPALILLDDRLADGYGSALCLSLKTNDRTKHIPVVLVSASPNLYNIAKKCNADGIIPKPFELEELVKIVSEFTFSTGNAIS